jgi:hypothetical protein
MLPNASASASKIQTLSQLPLSTYCGWLVITLSLVVLGGWQFDVSFLRYLIPGAPQTTPLTAAFLLMLALALLTYTRILNGQFDSAFVWVVWGLALIAIAGAVWFSITYIFNLRPGLGLLLYRQLVMELSSTYPGRPSPHTLIS